MSEKPWDLMIVGELNADILLTGDVTPEFGQVEKIIDDVSICAGSSSGIFAAQAAKLGLRVLLASRVGDDLLGHYMLHELEQAGVDTRHVSVDPAIKTGATVILSRGQDRAMLTFLGSIAAVGPAEVQDGWYAQVRHLHVASPFLLASLRPHLPEMMRRAHEAGATVSLDTNWDPAGVWALPGFFEHLDVFLPNQEELMAISGRQTFSEAVDAMTARVPVVAVKMGGEGAIGARRGTPSDPPELVHVAALPVDVVDTTGSGDSFDAGFLAGWLRGQPFAECLALGVACGGLTAARAGGFSGQPGYDVAMARARDLLRAQQA